MRGLGRTRLFPLLPPKIEALFNLGHLWPTFGHVWPSNAQVFGYLITQITRKSGHLARFLRYHRTFGQQLATYSRRPSVLRTTRLHVLVELLFREIHYHRAASGMGRFAANHQRAVLHINRDGGAILDFTSQQKLGQRVLYLALNHPF